LSTISTFIGSCPGKKASGIEEDAEGNLKALISKDEQDK
jgi:hypothetical protein